MGTGEQGSSGGRRAYYLTPPDLSEQIRRLHARLYSVESRQSAYVRYDEKDKDSTSGVMYHLHQQLSELEQKMANSNLDSRFEALASVTLQRIEAQEQRTSITLDALQRQINALQHKLAATKAQSKHSTFDQNQSRDLDFLRTCLLSHDVSHADRYSALNIIVRLRRDT